MHPKESQPISATALRSLPLVSGLRVHLGLQPFLGDSLGGAWPEAGAKGFAGYRSFVGLLQVILPSLLWESGVFFCRLLSFVGAHVLW